MGKTMRVSVEQSRSAILKIDVDEFCAHYSKEWAEEGGSKEEFVKKSLDIIGTNDLLDDTADAADGITYEVEDYDDSIMVLST